MIVNGYQIGPGANLRRANLWRADLRKADLREADLWEADLRWADLRWADLRGANLWRADLREADLREADLWGASLSHFQICPEKGAFTAWKKLSGGVVAEVEIRARSRRVSSLVGRKCRADYVVTKAFYVKGKRVHIPKGVPSLRDQSICYYVGKVTRSDKWDPDIRVECAHGIHFFMTRAEAEEW